MSLFSFILKSIEIKLLETAASLLEAINRKTPRVQKRDQKQGAVQFYESFIGTHLETCYSSNGHDIHLQVDYQYLHYNFESKSCIPALL